MNKEVQEEIRNLRGWIPAKEVQIETIKQKIEAQELLNEQIKKNKESGFFLKKADKEISEQITKLTIESKKIEKERVIRDLNNNYYTKLADIELRTLQGSLKMEENILDGINDKITKLSRNHKVEKSQDKETEEVKMTADLLEKEDKKEECNNLIAFDDDDKYEVDGCRCGDIVNGKLFVCPECADDIEEPSEAKE